MEGTVITVYNKEAIAEDGDARALLNACLIRANAHLSNGGECSLFIQPRNKDGWMEICMLYKYVTGDKLFVGQCNGWLVLTSSSTLK